MPHPLHEPTQALHECIHQCTDCYQLCAQLIPYCLESERPVLERVGLLMDVAEICRTTAHFLLRNSPLYPGICHACAHVCETAAQACEQTGDQLLRECAESCRRCAQACLSVEATT